MIHLFFFCFCFVYFGPALHGILVYEECLPVIILFSWFDISDFTKRSERLGEGREDDKCESTAIPTGCQL